MNDHPPNPFQVGVPIPTLLWGTFEDALRINIRRLAKDISTTLGVSDAPLLNAILKAPKGGVRPYLFEEAAANDSAGPEVDMRCCYMCQRPDAPVILQPCGQPVVWNAAAAAGATHRCAEHLYAEAPPTQKVGALPRLIPIDTNENGGRPLFRSLDGTVYDSSYCCCGQYNEETKTLILFEVISDESESA